MLSENKIVFVDINEKTILKNSAFLDLSSLLGNVGSGQNDQAKWFRLTVATILYPILSSLPGSLTDTCISIYLYMYISIYTVHIMHTDQIISHIIIL